MIAPSFVRAEVAQRQIDEIDAEFAKGVSDDKVRTVLENPRTLKFTLSDFEEG